MGTPEAGLRAWLIGLDDRSLRALLLLPGPLPTLSGIGAARNGAALRVGRRELRSAHVALNRAQSRELEMMAGAAVAYAAYTLQEHFGYSESEVAGPDLPTLTAMLERLEPVLARLTMYGIVIREAPASRLVREHWDELLEAAAGPGEPGGPGGSAQDEHDEQGETALHGLPSSTPPERTAETEEDDAVPDETTGADLTAAAEALRARADSLAMTLDQAAARVRAGSRVPDELVDELSAWSSERTGLATRLAEAGRPWSDEEDFAELRRLIAEIRAEEDAKTRRAKELAGLRVQHEQLSGALATASPGAPHLGPLRESLSLLEDRISALLGGVTAADVAPADERAPAPEGPAADPPGPSQAGEQAESPQTSAILDEPVATPTAPQTSAALDEPPAAPGEPEPAPVGRVDEYPPGTASAAPHDEDAHPSGTGSTTPHDEEVAAAPSGPSPRAAEPASGEEQPPETEFLPWRPLAATADTAHPVTQDSPVARLVREGRFQEAYWLTVGSSEKTHRADCLAFSDAAFSCGGEDEATAVLTGFVPDVDALRSDRSALVLTAAASVRAGMLVGWQNDFLLQTDLSTMISGPWGRFLESAVGVLRHFEQIDPVGDGLSTTREPVLTRERLGDEATELVTDLPRQRVGYARATHVRTRLLRQEQPLGKALTVIRAWADGQADAAALETVWELFRKRGSAERMIEEADAAIRTPKQAKEPIEAAAKRALLRSIDQVSDLLSRARALAAPAVGDRADCITALRRSLEQVRDVAPLPGVDGAALMRLRTWLLGADRPIVPVPVLEAEAGQPDGQPGAESLLAAPDLPRSHEGAPLPDADGFTDALLALLDPVDSRAVLRAYSQNGDLHLADAFVAALERDLVPCVPAGRDAIPGDWRQSREIEWARWSNRHRETHRAAAGLLAELRTQQNLSPETERDYAGRLEQLGRPAPEGAFGGTIDQIRALQEELRSRVDEYVERLRGSLSALNLHADERERLTALLDAGDTVTAEECLALLRKGDPLPDWSGTDWGAELAAFTAGLELDTAVKTGQGYSARSWADHFLGGQPLTSGAEVALDAWDALCDPTKRGSEWQRHVPSVLRLLGLECEQTPVRDDRRVRGLLRLTARATPIESAPGYVAALGSAASAYTILVVSDEQRGRSPLDLLDSGDTGACLIIYLYPLGLGGRRAMAEKVRTSSQQALVVDPAVFGWVAARSPRSFRAAQRLTLPWTAFTPYTPFVAGLVPPEVFYGRGQEMATVTDPLGALFLYGGRQLGKSALLRKVEATFPDTPERKAIYLDLKARGVGEAEPAERIWPVLAGELQRVGVLGRKVSPEAGPDVMLSQVHRWLEENPQRRILVLADEADAFLTADSKPVPGRGGDGTFANVVRLKGLMDRTDRRFKIVFAGLHQVQRFSHLSNVPLTHGGPDVLIGPLKPAEAQRLVVEPMAAFGYRFERPELVWRVLAATNYQACLVQIFCDRLVAALREKPLGSAQWPIAVTDEDVRAVASSAQVHRHIAERLRITINLEDRYRVLALVIALRSQADGFARGYSADELLSAAKQHWREGFSSLTASDVRIYLDEMVGLGLLIQQADRRRYAVRSPNVVHMLGTREDLELELRQTEFDLPYDYNPRFSRRLVGQDKEGIARYSPLTEDQLHLATGRGLSAVCLTTAFAPALVKEAVRSYSDARGLRVRVAGADDLADVLANDARDRKPSIVLADLHGCAKAELESCVERLGRHTSPDDPHRAAVLLVDPVTWDGRQDESVTSVVHPQRWNADSLRAWPECPFDTPDKRRNLVEVTGGWPKLVERTVHRTSRQGATLKTALDEMLLYTGRIEFARAHLEDVQLDDRQIELLSEWTAYLEPGEASSPADIASVTGLGLEQVHALTRRLVEHGVLDDGDDGYTLDWVTFRTLASLRNSS
ncbi:hypothetical protein GCM10023195_36450 [Actinoallomurus liliacearum]|uniref:AAA+ ATPase domain-containing protein n=1 Tax=Actinoallomurus liliacearum TaxID=1080073 RepID=A0ABP8TLI0_9ACTN